MVLDPTTAIATARTLDSVRWLRKIGRPGGWLRSEILRSSLRLFTPSSHDNNYRHMEHHRRRGVIPGMVRQFTDQQIVTGRIGDSSGVGGQDLRVIPDQGCGAAVAGCCVPACPASCAPCSAG